MSEIVGLGATDADGRWMNIRRHQAVMAIAGVVTVGDWLVRPTSVIGEGAVGFALVVVALPFYDGVTGAQWLRVIVGFFCRSRWFNVEVRRVEHGVALSAGGEAQFCASHCNTEVDWTFRAATLTTRTHYSDSPMVSRPVIATSTFQYTRWFAIARRRRFWHFQLRCTRQKVGANAAREPSDSLVSLNLGPRHRCSNSGATYVILKDWLESCAFVISVRRQPVGLSSKRFRALTRSSIWQCTWTWWRASALIGWRHAPCTEVVATTRRPRPPGFDDRREAVVRLNDFVNAKSSSRVGARCCKLVCTSSFGVRASMIYTRG
jgi:hypothetical protein